MARLDVFFCSDYLLVMSHFLCFIMVYYLVSVPSLRYIALVRRPPCELNISCTSTTAESRVKIWFQ